MDDSRIDVLVVTALKDELDALLDLEVDGEGRSAWTEVRDRHDFPFHVRQLSNEHGELLRLAAAWSGEMGETAATERAGTLIDELEPACLAMCGICAGKRGDVFLGDVIVANRVYAYDRGKHIAASEGREEQFLHDIETYNLQGSWGMDAMFFADEFQRSWEGGKERPPSKDSQQRWLLHTLYAHDSEGETAPLNHPERKTRCPGWASRIQELREDGFIKKTRGPLQLTKKGYSRVEDERMLDPEGERTGDPSFRIHVGPIATGKAVTEDPKLFELLKRSVRKVIGVEMEAAAIGFVAERRARRSIIVKAVSDYADLEKDDAYRRFACRASAAFLVAFIRRYLHPRELDDETARKTGRGRLSRREDKHLRESRHGEFLNRVEVACKLNQPEGARILRRAAPSPFDEVLEVSVPKGRFSRVFPVAALDQSPTDELLEEFIQKVHALYERENPRVVSTLVHIGVAAPEELARKAHQRQVELVSFAEYQGLIDFSTYLQRQTARLESDPIYPPELYVPQRALVSIGGQGDTSVENVLDALREMLGSPGPRFALVLGDFGTGKTFLLHELARRMGSENMNPVPVLIEMRSLQKGRRLPELVAQHFAAADMRRMEVDKFLYMLREGQIVLLFDGFDELALRVTYEQVMKHFDTLIEAAEGDAKVIITSRTQHFLTDHDVQRELARRAETLRGYRLIKLQRFSEEQIRRFLVNWLKNEDAAEEYLHLLRDVRDLLGLSENPRILSFIVGLGVEKLRSAREGSGEITSAKLYQLLIDQWIKGEHQRVNPEGAPKGLTEKQLRGAANDLAMLLWERTERTVGVGELPTELVAAVNAGGEHPLDAEVIKHQLGSGSLLVRDAEGRFSFIHQSVLEWLVAESAAEEVRTKGGTSALGRNEMSDLMVDFFTHLAGREVARAWAIAQISSPGDNIAQRNALRVLGRLRKSGVGIEGAAGPVVIKNFAGSDLRGQDLSREDLRWANLNKANLSGVTLVDANLEGAHLRESRLIRADLERAMLEGADLTSANLTGARLLGVDLRGALFQGTKLRAAKLVGAQVDSLEGCDVFGAAMPIPNGLEATVAAASPCRAVAFSKTDEILATGHEDGTVRLWDSVTGRALRVCKGHSDHVRSVAFSPDGATLASGSLDKTVRLWSVSDGKTLRVLDGHSGNVSSVAFSPDGATLASGSSDKMVRLWSPSDGRTLRILEGHSGNVWSVAFSPDGATLASGAADGTVRLWSITDGQLQRVLEGHSGNVWSVAFSPDGAAFASGSSERRVRLWNVADWQILRVLEGPSGNIWSVAFSPDGATLASGSSDETVRLWSIAEGRTLRVLEGPSGNVWSVAFSLDGATLASCSSEDRTVRLWSVAEGRPSHVLQGHSGNVLSIAFSHDGATLAFGSEEGMVQLWSVTEGRPLHALKGHLGNVLSIAFSPGGATLASGSSDAMVRLWSVGEGGALRVLKGHSGPVWSVAFSPDGATLASGSLDSTVRLWSVSEGWIQRVLKGHSGRVLSVAFSPDGATLASGSSDETVRLWSVAEGRPLRVLKGHSDYVRSVAFSLDGTTLASGAEDGKVRLWGIAEGRPLHVLEGHSDYVRSIAFSPDGVSLASGSEDGTVRLWSVAEGRSLRVLKGHSGGVWSVAFSPDRGILASSSEDGTVRFWNTKTGACLAVFLQLPPNGWVSFRPDGCYKLGGDIGGAFWHSVGLCRFEPGELDPYLPTSLRIPDTEPLLPSSR